MNLSTTVPLAITPEAAARVAELGMQAELARMLEQAVKLVHELVRLEVILEPAYDTGDVPYLTIRARVARSPRWDQKSRREWVRWQVTTFPPQVCQHITLTVVPLSSHGEPPSPLPSLRVPAEIPPEVLERVEELGMREEFRRMLEQIDQTVPGLLRIEVERYDRLEGGEPGVAITALTDQPPPLSDQADRELSAWQLSTFPPEVNEHFSATVYTWEHHAG